ncbi:MAG: hypothetical protein RLZZ520_1178 [Bacteroidota bacterium]
MRRNRSLLNGILIVFSAIFLIQCTKIKGTDIGAELLPVVDNINTFDTTFEVIATNFVTPDSLLPKIGRDARGNAGQYILGHISNDPQFGKTTASIFFELLPPGFPYFFQNSADSLYLDSAVLCLRWTNTFGDTNALQTINVHRVSELLRVDTAYNTGRNIRYGELIGSKTFAPKELDDSIFTFRQTRVNQLRIKLNNSFSRSLLAFDTSARSPYYNDTIFRDFFKGFALVPQTNGTSANALMSFAMSDTSTHLRLYYRYDKDGIRDTTYRDFKFNSLYPGAGVNYVQRVYNGSEAALHLGDKPRGDSLVYLQAAPGTYASLQIPGLTEFRQKKGNVIIHLAKLSMEEVETPGRRSSLFGTPEFLYLEFLDTLTNTFAPFVNDAFLDGQFEPLFFGGQRKYVKDFSNNLVSGYEMNITRYMQGIITRNNPNFKLRLYAPYAVRYEDLLITFALNNLARGNVVLGGGSHSSKKMKFRVIYSKL